MQLNEVFRIEKYNEASNFANVNDYTIIEVEAIKEEVPSVDGSTEIKTVRQFKIIEKPKPTQDELNKIRIAEIQQRLVELDQDIVQDIAGEIVPNIEERKAEFITLHNELRTLLGKEPRLTKSSL